MDRPQQFEQLIAQPSCQLQRVLTRRGTRARGHRIQPGLQFANACTKRIIGHVTEEDDSYCKQGDVGSSPTGE
jgi:hypothetical protein